MKILFIEPCFVGFGGYFRAINICSSLSKQGIRVDLLVASEKEFSFRIKKTRINENLTQYELPRFNLNFFFNGRILRGFIGFIFGLFGRYDIIHACVPVQIESNIPALLLKILGKKIVMDWDDYWSVSTIYGEYRIMKKYVSFCERYAPRFFKNIVVVSELLSSLAKKRGAINVLKLINGVNKNQFVPHQKEESRIKLSLRRDGKYLLAFGNTYINNRAYLLFKTFEKMFLLDSSIKLIFNYDPYKFIKEESLEGKIDDKCLKNIINVGRIPQEDMGYYLGACDASIFIIGDSDNERANFPIRIGSYLNGESIVIMNDVNSEAGNILKSFGCAIVEKNIDVLVQKSVQMLNNKEEQIMLKERVRKAKEGVSWENLIDKLIEFYKYVI